MNLADSGVTLSLDFLTDLQSDCPELSKVGIHVAVNLVHYLQPDLPIHTEHPLCTLILEGGALRFYLFCSRNSNRMERLPWEMA